ncbi:DUF4132 domain-containing protein [Chitinibacter sp. GC72]|uniref:DUF4132 domain-containing protein n=1 Tax=Chitinibacter sp. GC72 TaxID=1526917 RepID=UPI0012F8A9F3|nr:DUF4132 domain-containing protein [Chitinibacter sp. GC72]
MQRDDIGTAGNLSCNTPNGIAPWLKKNPVDLTKAMRAYALPNRANPGEPLQLDADTEWQAFAASLDPDLNGQLVSEWVLNELDDATRAACEEAIYRAQNRQREGSLPSEAALFAICSSNDFYASDALPLGRYLIAQYGINSALDILLAAEQLNIEKNADDISKSKLVQINQYSQRLSYTLCINRSITETLNGSEQFSGGEWVFRSALAQASDAERALALTQLLTAAPQLHPERRILLALLLPEYPDLAQHIAGTLPTDSRTLSWLAAVTISTEEQQRVISNSRNNDGYGFWWTYQQQFASTVIQQHGANAAVLLTYFVGNEGVADMLARIGTPEAIQALIQHAADGGKAKYQRLAKACERWPMAATAALATLLVKAGRHDKARYHTLLTPLLHKHADAVCELQAWLEPAAQEVLNELQTELAQQAANASAINSTTAEPAPEQDPQTAAPDPQASSLPAVLVSPPWLNKKKKAAISPLVLDILPLEPVEHWEEGQRERVISARQSNLNAISKTPERLAEVLLGSFYGSQSAERMQQYQAFVEPARQAIAANDAAGLCAAYLAYKASDLSRQTFPHSYCLLLLPEGIAQAVWPTLAAYDYFTDYFFMAKVGLKGLQGLLVAVERRTESGIAIAQHFGWAALAPAIAQAYLKQKTVRTNARNWLLKFPEHAITGLLPAALGKAGTARDTATTVLRMLADQGHAELIRQVAARYGQKEVDQAVQAMLNADPLDCFPARISKAPSFWAPQACPRPLLLDGTPLPDSALEHLGTMLRFPSSEGVYPGIEQVKAACQRDSLAAFVWQAFQQWQYAGAPAKDNWAFTALGLLGNDETVRQLVPLIRTWPTEGLLARAQSGLDVLVRIGSNYALLQLNGIGQKVKSKPLQLAAQQKMQELADNAGLTPDELAERITPDLGLDAAGGLDLDFGPRQFRAGFDEQLKPVVFNHEGVRLADLPKPNSSDNEYRAEQAQKQFKALKRDVKALADQSLKRLERAMCEQRRWQREIFESTLVQHPLLRHVTRRLAWGLYQDEQLQQVFRVAEDLGFTDAADNALTLPADAVIGLPHPLELDEVMLAALSQLFADYEIIQPFAQLGREVFRSDDPASALTQALDKAVPTNALRGLESRGWEKGDNFSGDIASYRRPGNGSGVATLRFDPPYSLAIADKTLRHKLYSLELHNPEQQVIVFEQLPQILQSELLRDLQYLQS